MRVEPMLRLIAGAFVAASVLLGMYVHPYFYWFTLFVGLIARVDPMVVFKDMLPYLGVLFGVLMLLTYVPWFSLWLPNLLMD